MSFWEITILILFTSTLLFIFFYSVEQAWLAFHFFRNRKKINTLQKTHKLPTNLLPPVTIQLPVFNEQLVVKRLITKVCQINYPDDKLQIQILDDSTDSTPKIIKEAIKLFPNKNIEYIHRCNRKGFKAGALKNGLTSATGEFIAIFDADFLPPNDFLYQTLPYFNNKNIGLVQTRWGHINKDFSLLTELQAFGLDAHFLIEQSARNAIGAYINFNGTAGVWRKSTILDAGNWHSDTLTEDLDLSYRAQLKGWQFCYLPYVITPAELPITVNALKTQQFRWTKGAAECAKKHLKKLIGNSSVPLKIKMHAMFHLLNSSVYLAILVLTILSYPVFFIKLNHSESAIFIFLGIIGVVSLLNFLFFYFIASQNKKQFLWQFPFFLAVSLGLLSPNSKAVLEAYFNKKSSFVRTPKFNISSNQKQMLINLPSIKTSFISILDGILLLYAATGIYLSIQYREFGFVFLWGLLFVGTLILELNYVFLFLKVKLDVRNKLKLMFAWK